MGKARIAVARKLGIRLWIMMRDQIDYQYYGRRTNSRSLWQFYRAVCKIWRKWLSHRTRGKELTWEQYNEFLRHHSLLLPWITHSWNCAVSGT